MRKVEYDMSECTVLPTSPFVYVLSEPVTGDTQKDVQKAVKKHKIIKPGKGLRFLHECDYLPQPIKDRQWNEDRQDYDLLDTGKSYDAIEYTRGHIYASRDFVEKKIITGKVVLDPNSPNEIAAKLLQTKVEVLEGDIATLKAALESIKNIQSLKTNMLLMKAHYIADKALKDIFRLD